MGRKHVAKVCLDLLMSRPDVEVAGVITDSHLVVSETADRAREAGLPLFTFDTACEAIREGGLAFDLGLSMLYWRRLVEPLLGAARYGTINFHPAPLPDYKGVGGYNLAILEGLEHWAATAHFVDALIDTGPIVNRIRFPIDAETETAQTLERKSQVFLLQLFKETLAKVLADPSNVKTTPNGPGRYLSRPGLEALKRIDPERDDIDRKVRAFWFPPYDGAYLEFQGQKFTLVNRPILQSLADPAASSLFSPPSENKTS